MDLKDERDSLIISVGFRSSSFVTEIETFLVFADHLRGAHLKWLFSPPKLRAFFHLFSAKMIFDNNAAKDKYLPS